MVCLPLFLKLSTLIICFIGGISGYIIANINFFSFNKSLNYYLFSFFSSSIWFIPTLSTIGAVYYPVTLSFKLFKNLDQGWFEFFGIQQIFKIFIKFSLIIQFIQFNNLKVHLSFFVF